MHVHQGMRYAANGRDAFHDAGDPHGLSSLAKHFIAGQLAHARGACAILAPLVNSYKRLFAGYEAPVHISWAQDQPRGPHPGAKGRRDGEYPSRAALP